VKSVRPFVPTNPIAGVKLHCTTCDTTTIPLACDDGTILRATCKCGTFTWTVSPEKIALIAIKRPE
jgi:hypothetical protein